MSSEMDRRRAMEEQKFREKAERLMKQIELERRQREMQGALVGDIFAAGAEASQTGLTGWVARYLPSVLIVIVGLWAAYLLGSAA